MPPSKETAVLCRSTRDALSTLRRDSDPAQLERALNQLCDLVVERECVEIMVQYGDGADKIVLEVMASWPMAFLQAAGCNALACFTKHCPTLCQRLEKADALRTVISSILRHPADPFVQYAAMSCLSSMAGRSSPAIRRELRQDDKLRMIVQVMTTHQFDVQVQLHGCRVFSVLLSNPEEDILGALNWFVRSDEHWRLVKALINHVGNADVQTEACRALWRLSSHPELRAQLVDRAVYTHVIKAMRDMRTQNMQLAGCAFAESLSFLHDWTAQKQMLQTGLLDVVLLAMPTFKGCAELQQYACGVLDNMAKVAVSEGYDCHTWPRLLHIAMSNHTAHVSVQMSACLAVDRVLSVQRDLQELIGDAVEEEMAIERKMSQQQERESLRRKRPMQGQSLVPLHHDVVVVLNVHGLTKDGSSIALAALHAVYWLADGNPRLRRLLLMKGVHMSVVSCLGISPNLGTLQLWGLRALRELCEGSYQSNRNDVYNAGAPSVALAALENFPSDPDVQCEAICLLACLCYVVVGVSGSSVSKDQGGQHAVWRFCEADFHCKVLNAMQSHYWCTMLQEVGMEALSAIAQLTTLSETLIELHAVDIVLFAMDEHVGQLGIQWKGCMLLRLLACTNLFSTKEEEEELLKEGMVGSLSSTDNSAPYAIAEAQSATSLESWVLDGHLSVSDSDLLNSSYTSDDNEMNESARVDSPLLKTNKQRCVKASKVITQAMRKFSTDSALLTEACVAMKELARLSAIVKEEFIRHDGHLLLFRILREEEISEVLSIAVRQAIFLLCTTSLKGLMLQQAVAEDDVPVVHCLLLLGADVNFVNPDRGLSVLCLAAELGRKHLVDILLQHNVNDLRQPLQIALTHGHYEIVGQILQAFVADQRLPGVALLNSLSLGMVRPEWLAGFMLPAFGLASSSASVSCTDSSPSSRRSSIVLEDSRLQAQGLLVRIRGGFFSFSNDRLASKYMPPLQQRRRMSMGNVQEALPVHGKAPTLSHGRRSLSIGNLLEKVNELGDGSSPRTGRGKFRTSVSVDQISSSPDDLKLNGEFKVPLSPPSLSSSRDELTPSRDSLRHLNEVDKIVSKPFPALEYNGDVLDTDDNTVTPLARASPYPHRHRQSLSGIQEMPFVLFSSSAVGSTTGSGVSNGVTRHDMEQNFEPEDRRHLGSPRMLQRMVRKCARTVAESSALLPRPPSAISQRSRAMRSMSMSAIRDLDLSDNGIETLENLHNVSLLSSAFAGLERLNLSQNKLTDFPSILSSWLCSLRSLMLSENCFQSFPNSLLRIPSLERLSLAGNSIASLDEAVEIILKTEELTGSVFEDVSTGPSSPLSPMPLSPALSHSSSSSSSLRTPSPLSPYSEVEANRLFDVSFLDLSENCLQTLPRDLPLLLPQLKVLLLANNKLFSFPATVGPHFHQLTELNISGNQLDSLPEETFSEMPLLEKLVADNNRLCSLPSASCGEHLVQLYQVELSNNCLSLKEPPFLPEFLLALPRLRFLDVSSNNLIGLPSPAQWRGNNLRTLLAANNKIKALQLGSTAGQHWPGIDRLNLSHNCLREIPKDIDQLATLTSFNVEFNKDITTLPPSLGNLRKLWDFPRKNLIGLNLEPALLQANTKELMNYLYDKLYDSVKYYRIRMLLVGLAAQGKTSLLFRLTSQEPSRRPSRVLTLSPLPRKSSVQPKLSVPSDAAGRILSTVGINVSEWKVLRRLGRDRERYTISCWDFAGQEEYYSTHQCFLSSRSLYLAVFNLSTERGLEKLKPWLLNIQARAPGCPVIIVGTHLDQLEVEQRDFILDDCKQSIHDMCGKPGMPDIIDIVWVDARDTNPTIGNLRAAVLKAVDKFPGPGGRPLMGERVPASCVALEERIVKEASRLKIERSPFPVITKQRLGQLASELSPKLNKEQLSQAVRFLHEAGVLLHYKDSQSDLGNLFFPDPEWLCMMMARIVTIREVNPFIKNGVMPRDNLSLLFKSDKFPSGFINDYVQLLQKFEVVLPHEHNGVQSLIIPSLLPPKRKVSVTSLPNGSKIRRNYSMPYMPVGFMARLIARLYTFADTMLPALPKPHREIWRAGVCVTWTLMRAYFLVEENSIRDSTVTMTVPCNNEGRRLLGYLSDHFETLLEEWYEGLLGVDICGHALVEAHIPCPVCYERLAEVDEKTEQSYHEFSLAALMTASEERTTVECPIHKAYVAINDLAPDIMLGDLPQDLLVDNKELQFNEAHAHRLGSGGSGNVYRWIWRGKQVAIKAFRSQALAGSISNSPHCLLRQEVQVMRHLHHPSIVVLEGVSLHPRLLIIELAPLGSLRSLLERNETLFRNIQHRIIYQVADGLQFLHDNRIIYRDLKAANVLMFSKNATSLINAKIADLGISRFADPAGLAKPTGTIGYRGPEMIATGAALSYNKSADIYSFGIFLYELATGGHRPFEELSFAVEVDNQFLEGKPIELLTEHGVPPWPDVQDAIAQCLQRPGQRPSAEELADRFSRAESLCLHHSIAISLGMTAEAMAVRQYFDDTRTERCEVWICSGSALGQFSQLSILELNNSPSPPRGMMLRDRLILCITPVPVNNQPLIMLVGCLSGKLWRYEAVTESQQAPYCVVTMPDAVVSLRHIEDSHGSNVVVAGLANGYLAVIDHEQLFEADLSVSDIKMQHLGTEPVMDMCVHSSHLWCACGMKVLVLERTDWSVVHSVEVKDREKTRCTVSNVCIHQGILWTAVRGSALINCWSADEDIGLHRGEIDCAEVVRGSLQAGEKVQALLHVVNILIVNSVLWAGLSDGHLLLLDTKTRQALTVVHRHAGAIRCMASVRFRTGANRPAYVLSGGMGYIPRPGLALSDKGQPLDVVRSQQFAEITYGHVLVWDTAMGQVQQQLVKEQTKRRLLVTQPFSQGKVEAEADSSQFLPTFHPSESEGCLVHRHSQRTDSSWSVQGQGSSQYQHNEAQRSLEYQRNLGQPVDGGNSGSNTYTGGRKSGERLKRKVSSTKSFPHFLADALPGSSVPCALSRKMSVVSLFSNSPHKTSYERKSAQYQVIGEGSVEGSSPYHMGGRKSADQLLQSGRSPEKDVSKFTGSERTRKSSSKLARRSSSKMASAELQSLRRPSVHLPDEMPATEDSPQGKSSLRDELRFSSMPSGLFPRTGMGLKRSTAASPQIDN